MCATAHVLLMILTNYRVNGALLATSKFFESKETCKGICKEKKR